MHNIYLKIAVLNILLVALFFFSVFDGKGVASLVGFIFIFSSGVFASFLFYNANMDKARLILFASFSYGFFWVTCLIALPLLSGPVISFEILKYQLLTYVMIIVPLVQYFLGMMGGLIFLDFISKNTKKEYAKND